MSDIWKYFEKNTIDEAKCKICKKILKRSDGSTKGLWKHLGGKHEKEFKNLKSNEAASENAQVFNYLYKYKIKNNLRPNFMNLKFLSYFIFKIFIIEINYWFY